MLKIPTAFRNTSLGFALSVFITGCASYGTIENEKIDAPEFGSTFYSVEAFNHRLSGKDTVILLAFSGGGSRAAALSYGVLSELNETTAGYGNSKRTLIDDIGLISAVSGGSFTAAYYGLHGKKIFSEFESRFLRKNVERSLINNVLNPLNWFNRKSRTEYAIKYYDKEVFDGATFKDMLHPDRPMVLINATDLSKGVRFSFMQEYFNLLCSDLTNFSVSRAVTASSAVPLLFNPVVIENHPGCADQIPSWLVNARDRATTNPELSLLVEGLESYFKKDNHQYAHFVDGGITDNLALRSVFDITNLLGGAKATNQAFNITPPKRMIVISVNASTNPDYGIANSPNPPGLLNTINAMTDIQVHRSNIETISDLKFATNKWAEELSDENNKIESHFVTLGFDDINNEELKQHLNQIPTTLSLTSEQTDLLIETGRNLLRNNPMFLKALESINGQP